MTRVLDRPVRDLQEFDKHLEHGSHVPEIVTVLAFDGRFCRASRARVRFGLRAQLPPPESASVAHEKAASSGKEAAKAPQRATLVMNDGSANAPRARPTTVSVAVCPLASR